MSKSTPKIWASEANININSSSNNNNLHNIVSSRKLLKSTESVQLLRQFQSSWSKSLPRSPTPWWPRPAATTTSQTRTGSASTATSPFPIRRSTSCTAASTARPILGGATAAASSARTSTTSTPTWSVTLTDKSKRFPDRKSAKSRFGKKVAEVKRKLQTIATSCDRKSRNLDSRKNQNVQLSWKTDKKCFRLTRIKWNRKTARMYSQCYFDISVVKNFKYSRSFVQLLSGQLFYFHPPKKFFSLNCF